MQPSWFDARRKLVSELDAGAHKERTRSSQPEFDECDEFNEREKKTFNVTGERLYAGSKSAVRRIPYFEADRDRNLCVVTWGNERKGCRFRNSFKTIKSCASNKGDQDKGNCFEWELFKNLT